MIKSKVAEMLRLKYPVFQGGMAWVATAELASAVSNAGGLGIIGAGSMDGEILLKEISKIRGLIKSEVPFGVNLMLLNPFIDDLVDIVIKEKVASVIIKVNSTSLRNNNEIKFTPDEARY